MKRNHLIKIFDDITVNMLIIYNSKCIIYNNL